MLDRQQAFGYTQEDIKVILEPMVQNGEEATGSMGTDSALPVLSNKNKTLYNYFKQLFAQVTNPPIDPIREELVMSLVSFIGPKPNLLNTHDINPPIRLEVSQPVLTCADMEKLRNIEKYTSGKFRSFELDICYPVAWGTAGVEARLASLAADAEDAVRSGANILIVSDRKVDAAHVAIPALLATSAIHQHLVTKGLRTSAGLVVETGSARETHHFALLGGYGAEAVHPYLALETIEALAKGDAEKAEKYVKNYIKAIGKGLMQGHVQDGHFHLHVLHRRADLRSHRPEEGFRREVLHRHAVQHRRHRRLRGCRGSDPPASAKPSRPIRCWPTCSMPAANTPSASAAKSTCGRRMPSPSCSMRRAPASSKPTRNTPS